MSAAGGWTPARARCPRRTYRTTPSAVRERVDTRATTRAPAETSMYPCSIDTEGPGITQIPLLRVTGTPGFGPPRGPVERLDAPLERNDCTPRTPRRTAA